MAQLSGVMTADFSDFMFEIDKSVVKLKDLEGASGKTNNAMGGLTEGLGAVDKTLGLFGIRIGPQIQALRELGDAANVTWEKLGTLGGLSLAAGVGVATYQITAAALEWSGLNEKIAESIALLAGWGDVGLAKAQSQIDLFARASNIAGREIRDVNVAMAILKQHNAEVAESFNTGAARVEQWNREIAAARSKGDLPAITADLKNHTSTVQELSTHYGISTRALEYYTRTLGDSAKAQKTWADEARPRYEAIAKAQLELNQAGDGWRQTLATITPAVAAAVTQHLALGQSQTTIATAYSLSKLQVDALDKAYKEQIATLAALEPKTQSLDTWMRTVGQQFAVAAESGDQFKTMLELTGGTVDAVVPKIEKLEERFHSLTTAMAPGVAPGMTQMSPGNAPVPINTGPITYGTLGSFEATFAEYQRRNPSGGMLGGAIGGGPPKDFLTWALSMGLAQRGPTVTNTFNIVDTESGIARRVGDTISSQIQRGSLVN